MALVLDRVVEGHVDELQAVDVTGIQAVGRQNTEVRGLRILLRHLRHVVRIVYPALGLRVPIHARQQRRILGKERIDQPGQILSRRRRHVLRVIPSRAQLLLLHGVAHPHAAAVGHMDVLQRHILDLAVGQTRQRDRVARIHIRDVHIAHVDVVGVCELLIAHRVAVVHEIRFRDLLVRIDNVGLLLVVPLVGVVLAGFLVVIVVVGVQACRRGLVDRGHSHAVGHGHIIVGVVGGIVVLDGILRPGVLAALGVLRDDPTVVRQADVVALAQRRAGAVAGDGIAAAVADTDINRGAAHGVHLRIDHEDVMDVRAVHRLEAEAAGALEGHIRDRHGVVTAGGLGAELDACGRTAGVGGNLLVGGVGACQHRASVIAGHSAVADQAVMHRLEDACAVGGLEDNGVVCQGVEGRILDGHILAAVDVECVAVGVHHHAVHQHVLRTLHNDGEVAAVEDIKVREHHVLAAQQRHALVAVPVGNSAGAISGIARIVAVEHLIQGTGAVHLAAVKTALAVDHDVLLVGAVDEAVGEIGMAAILQAGVDVDLRLEVIAVRAVVILVLANLGRLKDRALGQVDVDVVLQLHGVDAEGARRDHDRAAVLLIRREDGSVDGSGVFAGMGVRVALFAVFQGDRTVIGNVELGIFLEQRFLGDGRAGGQGNAVVLSQPGQVDVLIGVDVVFLRLRCEVQVTQAEVAGDAGGANIGEQRLIGAGGNKLGLSVKVNCVGSGGVDPAEGDGRAGAVGTDQLHRPDAAGGVGRAAGNGSSVGALLHLDFEDEVGSLLHRAAVVHEAEVSGAIVDALHAVRCVRIGGALGGAVVDQLARIEQAHEIHSNRVALDFDDVLLRGCAVSGGNFKDRTLSNDRIGRHRVVIHVCGGVGIDYIRLDAAKHGGDAVHHIGSRAVLLHRDLVAADIGHLAAVNRFDLRAGTDLVLSVDLHSVFPDILAVAGGNGKDIAGGQELVVGLVDRIGLEAGCRRNGHDLRLELGDLRSVLHDDLLIGIVDLENLLGGICRLDVSVRQRILNDEDILGLVRIVGDDQLVADSHGFAVAAGGFLAGLQVGHGLDEEGAVHAQDVVEQLSDGEGLVGIHDDEVLAGARNAGKALVDRHLGGIGAVLGANIVVPGVLVIDLAGGHNGEDVVAGPHVVLLRLRTVGVLVVGLVGQGDIDGKGVLAVLGLGHGRGIGRDDRRLIAASQDAAVHIDPDHAGAGGKLCVLGGDDAADCARLVLVHGVGELDGAALVQGVVHTLHRQNRALKGEGLGVIGHRLGKCAAGSGDLNIVKHKILDDIEAELVLDAVEDNVLDLDVGHGGALIGGIVDRIGGIDRGGRRACHDIGHIHVSQLRRVGAQIAFLVLGGAGSVLGLAVHQRLGGLDDRAVLEVDVLDQTAAIGVGLEAQDLLEVGAVVQVVRGEDIAHAAGALTAAGHAAVAVGKVAVADDEVLAGLAADLAAGIAVAVLAGLDGDAVVAGVEAAVLDDHIAGGFGIDAVIVGAVGIDVQAAHQHIFAAQGMDLPHGRIDDLDALDEHILAGVGLNGARTHQRKTRKNGITVLILRGGIHVGDLRDVVPVDVHGGDLRGIGGHAVVYQTVLHRNGVVAPLLHQGVLSDGVPASVDPVGGVALHVEPVGAAGLGVDRALAGQSDVLCVEGADGGGPVIGVVALEAGEHHGIVLAGEIAHKAQDNVLVDVQVDIALDLDGASVIDRGILRSGALGCRDHDAAAALGAGLVDGRLDGPHPAVDLLGQHVRSVGGGSCEVFLVNLPDQGRIGLVGDHIVHIAEHRRIGVDCLIDAAVGCVIPVLLGGIERILDIQGVSEGRLAVGRGDNQLVALGNGSVGSLFSALRVSDDIGLFRAVLRGDLCKQRADCGASLHSHGRRANRQKRGRFAVADDHRSAACNRRVLRRRRKTEAANQHDDSKDTSNRSLQSMLMVCHFCLLFIQKFDSGQVGIELSG